MSAVSHRADNAACGGLCGLLKREQVRHCCCQSRIDARADLFDYLQLFPNPRMRRRVARSDRAFSASIKPSVGAEQNPGATDDSIQDSIDLFQAAMVMNRFPLDPQLVGSCRSADALLRAGRYAEAADAYRGILSRDVSNADVWYNLGYALKALGRFEDALSAYDGALRAGVGDPQEVHLNRAVIYSDHLRRDELAKGELLAALAIRPDYIPAWLNLGLLHEECGDREKAVACYERVLLAEGGPEDARRPEALARLAHLKRPDHPDAPQLGILREAAESARDPQTRANLWFALGQAHEHLSSVDLAFEAFTRANACCRQQAPGYDRRSQERFVDALIAQFNLPVADRPLQPGPQPVFICGMFRSGSTLLEQALAAHPLICAAGELDILPRMVSGQLSPFPSSMAAITEVRLDELSGGYLDALRKLPSTTEGAAYVSDKRPDNFLLVGLIKHLFPRAKILHTVRHPLDNGLSIFMQHLDPRVAPYATDLQDIGHYYMQYRRMMEHWKSLYPGSIHDVDYDSLVLAPKDVLASALDFLGLEWWPGCLRFHELSNTVKTASYWQVRRPLYRDASGRWRRYETKLRPLREVVERRDLPR